MCWAFKDTGFDIRKRKGHTAISRMPLQKQGQPDPLLPAADPADYQIVFTATKLPLASNATQ
jgi:hypothetical protein